jgi:phosphatidylglycerophosphate synthase
LRPGQGGVSLSMLRRVPNILTSLRIAAIPVLVWLAAVRMSAAFTALMIACLIGDLVDGFLARALNAASPLGAMLDSVADALLFAVCAFGAWRLHPEIVGAHRTAFVAIPAIWLGEYAAALLRYGRLSAFHTYLARMAAYVLGLVVGLLFIGAFQAWLLYVALALAVISTSEELILLWILPTWRSDVRGLWWVLREQSA